MRLIKHFIITVLVVFVLFGGTYWLKYIEGPRQTTAIQEALLQNNLPLDPTTVFDAIDEITFIFVETDSVRAYPIDISMNMFQDDGLDLGWYLKTSKAQYACEYGERDPIPPKITFTLYHKDTQGPMFFIESRNPLWKIERGTYTLSFETERSLVSIWVYENKVECNQSNWAVFVQPK